jgi:hypothetical protein
MKNYPSMPAFPENGLPTLTITMNKKIKKLKMYFYIGQLEKTTSLTITLWGTLSL